MILPPIVELALVGVTWAGVPNQERLVIRPTEMVNLAQFGILLCVNTGSSLMPLSDDFFWFGERVVQPPAWLVIYTGKGEYRETILKDSGQKAHVFHWGKSYTVFDIPGVTPVLVRFDAVLAGMTPVPISLQADNAQKE